MKFWTALRAWSLTWCSRKLPRNKMELNRWMVTEIRWSRCAVSLASPVQSAIRRPSSSRKERPRSLIGPNVSKIIGQKQDVFESSTYFTILRSDAISVALPTITDVVWMYDAATVLTIDTSHVRFLPACHGMSVKPSSRLLSVLNSPLGSLIDGMLARIRARCIKSLIEWWRARRPDPCLHDKEWLPLASTSSPHIQSRGLLILHPNLSPTAILIASLSRRRPHEEIGIASNQSPLWGADVARAWLWCMNPLRSSRVYPCRPWLLLLLLLLLSSTVLFRSTTRNRKIFLELLSTITFWTLINRFWILNKLNKFI